MSVPKVEYRGHVIIWSDNDDKWRACDFDFSHQSLAKCRERIDKEYRALRNKSAVQCLKLDGGSGFTPEGRPATLVEYLGAKEERSWSTKELKAVKHRVAAMYIWAHSEKQSRNQCDLGDFAADTPEVLAMIALAKEKQDAARTLLKEGDAIMRSIPRLTEADIAGLIRAADTNIGGTHD